MFAQLDSIFTETDVYAGTVTGAMSYSLFFQSEAYEQIGIPTAMIERLVLADGEEIIGRGVPTRRYYQYLDTFDAFPTGIPDSLRANPRAPGTRSVMEMRSAMDISEPGTPVVDADGNTYRTIRIGSQTWMAENLRVTHYRDGTPIPLLMLNEDWTSIDSGAMALYDAKNVYGILYNWYAATDHRELAPEGWHIPSDAEWIEMEEVLGMNAFETRRRGAFRGDGVGGKLSGDRERWEPGVLTTDHQFATTEFRALPGGYRGYLNGTFSCWGSAAFFWSSSATNSGSAWYRNLDYNHSGIYRDRASKRVGLAIRCIKDTPRDPNAMDLARSSEDKLEGFTPSVANRIMNARLWKGMTMDMARLSLGEPDRVNRTAFDFTSYERWVYPEGQCLFFRSGVLTSWEDEEL